MKWSIKITNKKIDSEGFIWYRCHVRNVNLWLLQWELSCLFGRDRLIKVLGDDDDSKNVTVVIDPRA